MPSLFTGSLGGLLSRGLLTLILFACLYLVANNRQDLMIGIVLAVPAAIANWLPAGLLEITTQMVIYTSLKIVFLVYIIIKILKYLVMARRVNAEVISAAICLYLIIGLTWTFTYFGIVSLNQD